MTSDNIYHFVIWFCPITISILPVLFYFEIQEKHDKHKRIYTLTDDELRKEAKAYIDNYSDGYRRTYVCNEMADRFFNNNSEKLGKQISS